MLLVVVDESGLLLSTFSKCMIMRERDEVEVTEDIAVILSSDFQ